jgi:hypothetical protein
MAKWIKVQYASSDHQSEGAYVNLDHVDSIGVDSNNGTYQITFYVPTATIATQYVSSKPVTVYYSVATFSTAEAAHDAVAKLLGKSDLPSLA